jgi:hypothetical protein
MALGRPKNPRVAGCLSAVLPGLGQFYCRAWAKGAGFLVGTILIDGFFGVTPALLKLLESSEPPFPLGTAWRMVVGLLLWLGMAVWSILDAVRLARNLSRT